MRLQEPSSSQGGPFATPLRGRDSLAYVQPPTGQRTGPLLAPTGIGFRRPSTDFPSIFSGNSGSNASAPIASAPLSPTESTRKTNTEDDTVEPLDDEQEEAVQENDSVAVQPLAGVVEAPVDVTELASEVLATENAARVRDSQADRQTRSAADSSARSITDTSASSESRDSLGTITELDRSQNESATVGRAKSTGDLGVTKQGNLPSQTNVGASGQDAQSLATELVMADVADQANLQITTDNEPETGRASETSNAELAAQAQRQLEQAASGRTSVSGEANADSSRLTRNGRGRIGGNATQKDRAAGTESLSKTPENAAPTNIQSLAGQTDAIHASPTSDPAVTDTPATATDPTTVDLPLSEAAIVAGQAVGTAAPEAGNRPLAAGGSASEMAAIGPSSSDDSRRNGDPLPSRGAENLSRTDIADRARLIHRISKAFTKMGVDGGQIRMKMHPETLGGVLLEMRVRGRNVEATVTADNEAARGVLQQQLSELRQRLESQGLTVQRLEVALRDETATGGSLLSDNRGEMAGGDRGSDGYDHSRRPGGSEIAGRTGTSTAINGSGAAGNASLVAQSRGPAAPGTLDLRL